MSITSTKMLILFDLRIQKVEIAVGQSQSSKKGVSLIRYVERDVFLKISRFEKKKDLDV
jgi:hypothetical protein